MPRFKKVKLQELINALDVAITTESRRINKEIQKKQAERLSHVDIPKFRRINIKERIRQFYARVLSGFKNKKGEVRLPYSHFTGESKEEKIACFLPMLYLSNNGKVWLEQESHYSEIWLYIYEIFKKVYPEFDKHLIDEDAEEKKKDILEDLKDAIESVESQIESERNERVEEINEDFENPIGDLISSGVELDKGLLDK